MKGKLVKNVEHQISVYKPVNKLIIENLQTVQRGYEMQKSNEMGETTDPGPEPRSK